MERILICGDSFAADWTLKYTGQGWPNYLQQEFQVTNLAQAGCSEYKIWLQIKSIIDKLDDFDHVIISHTSPFRIYVRQHPVHHRDPLHHSSDLIYSDLLDKLDQNKDIRIITEWFEKYFDLDQAKFVHNLICQEIDKVMKEKKVQALHITNLDWSDLYQFDNMLQFEYLFKNHRGLMNHYNETGNKEIFSRIKQCLSEKKQA